MRAFPVRGGFAPVPPGGAQEAARRGCLLSREAGRPGGGTTPKSEECFRI